MPRGRRLVTTRSRRRSRGGDEFAFGAMRRADELTHHKPIRQAPTPMNPYREEDTHAVVAHIDDNALLMLAEDSEAGIEEAERVREQVIKGTFREENLPVDSTERGKAKDRKAPCGSISNFWGLCGT